MKKVLMAFGFTLTTLFSFAQSTTVVDIIVNSDDHTLLEAAVLEADLVGALSDTTGDFTVFAPTDNAVTALITELDITAEEFLALETLSDILLYHVVNATALSTDLMDGDVFTTLNGEDVTITITDSTVMVNDAMVTMADITTDNGVVHVIDVVLLPPTETVVTSVWDLIESSDIHNYLEAAVIAGGLQETLEGEGTFTVFAPTDDAFISLATTLGVEVTDLLVLPNLTDILLYHVLGTTVMSTDLYDGLEATTVGGGTLTVGVGETVTINGTATVVLADLEAQNGVVHVIDAVLISDQVNNVIEIVDDRVNNGIYYNIMGQEIRSYQNVPLNSPYILNGRKYVKINE
jgi:uncharacterized surface protein with fasciclin (FAS1) repeats